MGITTKDGADAPDLRINEVVGFLHEWSPGTLAKLEQNYGEQRAAGMFKPGIPLGETPVADDKVKLLRSYVEPLLAALPSMIERAEAGDTSLRRRLTRSAMLTTWCDMLAAIGSSVGGATAVFGKSDKSWVASAVAWAVTLASALIAIWGRWYATGTAGEKLVDAFKGLHVAAFEGRRIERQLRMLLPDCGIETIYQELTRLVEEADQVAGRLNDLLHQLPS